MSDTVFPGVRDEGARLDARRDALNVTDFLLECSRLFPGSDHEIPPSAWESMGAVLVFLKERIEAASPEEEVRHG